MGTIKGVGLIYHQTFIDTYSRVATAKLYTEKTAITAADLLNDRVTPFFEEQGIKLQRILTDRGTEYWGKPENHAYQLYLAVEDIDHSRTKANHPQTNGICERFHKTMQDECYSLLFRKKLYRSLEELQVDVDAWLRKYNWHGDRSNEVNDYLSSGWILVNTGTEASTGDSGPHSWVYYVVGWIGEGEPEFPPAHPLPSH